MKTPMYVLQSMLLLVCLSFTNKTLAQDEIIPVDSLPQIAQQFISEHFADQKVIQVEREKELLMIQEYEVTLNNSFQLEFDPQGNWEKVDGNHQGIPTGFIPETILQYTTANFPNEQITEIDKGRRTYELELSNGLELKFNLEGQFLRLDD